MIAKTTIQLIIFSLFFSITSLCQSQNNFDWKQVKSNGDIKAYVKKQEGSKIKMVKVETVTEATLSELVCLITDADNHSNWVFMNDHGAVLETMDCSNWVYYGYTDLPWPVSDRDIITISCMTQDSIDYSVKIEARACPNYIPDKNECIRINHVHSLWSLNPLGNGKVHISFELAIDIGGNIPKWLLNLGVTKGPLTTMEGLLDQLAHRNYSDRSRKGIKEYKL